VSSSVRATLLRMANETVSVEIDGRQRRARMSRFEASVLELGSGKARRRSALLSFIGLVRMAAQTEDQMREPPKRYPSGPEEYGELETAAASGSLDQWEVAIARFLARLPGATELSDRELLRSMKMLRRGQMLEWPAEVEERIFALIDILNRAD
jgi:hypothetical protein